MAVHLLSLIQMVTEYRIITINVQIPFMVHRLMRMDVNFNQMLTEMVLMMQMMHVQTLLLALQSTQTVVPTHNSMMTTMVS